MSFTLSMGSLVLARHPLHSKACSRSSGTPRIFHHRSPALPSSLLSVSISAPFITNFDAPRLARIRLALHGEDMEGMVLEGGSEYSMAHILRLHP